jgi:hypothetical protein
MHTTKYLKDKKNHHIVFSYNKKNHIVFFIHKTQNIQKYVLSCTLALITSLLEP